ncbi:3-isopropylmalate dehydratase small subunit [Phenylobacterium sp.]|uniref:3-isopropylmalate dehydratase small subunit n=1 Tax=Phenylobacterium sp. TaxID=1871053 RepID=UPI002735F6CA|nr:3-isopropylmalate dehydratase small subunit [Phenylobacterium sp.]MDP3659269.1 3-isopropylmalate dehydratase small subunit [Phenylobacterium sp.]
MEAFNHLDGRMAPLPMANIDTDQIIPKQFLKTVDRVGLGAGLFYDLRFTPEGRERPDFILNRPEYKGASVLVAGDNFGCGSSREHAPWALMDFGVRCVISTSFADIFYNNCFQNGLLPVVLKPEEVQALMDEAQGGNHLVTVDLAEQTVVSPTGLRFHFDIDPARKHKMQNGLDAIGETLQAAKDIDVYEMRQAISQPWLERA